MAGFRTGEIRHLVTTDVASRGIDIEDLSHVFIFSTPDSPEQYIHRAGRTGRVGKSGRAISLVSAHDLMNFNRLVKRYHVEVKELDGALRRGGGGPEGASASWPAWPPRGRAAPGGLRRARARGAADRAHEQRDRIVALLLRKFFELPRPRSRRRRRTRPRPARPCGARPPERGRFDPRRRRRRR